MAEISHPADETRTGRHDVSAKGSMGLCTGCLGCTRLGLLAGGVSTKDLWKKCTRGSWLGQGNGVHSGGTAWTIVLEFSAWLEGLLVNEAGEEAEAGVLRSLDLLGAFGRH